MVKLVRMKSSMLLLEAHHHKQRVGGSEYVGSLFGSFETEIGSICFRALEELLWPVGTRSDHDNFQVFRRFNPFDEGTQHSSMNISTEPT